MEAVKSLPVHNHSAGYILFSLGSLSPSWCLENRILIKPALVGARGRMQPQKRLNQTESPIFVILCVLCFQRQSFILQPLSDTNASLRFVQSVLAEIRKLIRILMKV